MAFNCVKTSIWHLQFHCIISKLSCAVVMLGSTFWFKVVVACVVMTALQHVIWMVHVHVCTVVMFEPCTRFVCECLSC